MNRQQQQQQQQQQQKQQQQQRPKSIHTDSNARHYVTSQGDLSPIRADTDPLLESSVPSVVVKDTDPLLPLSQSRTNLASAGLSQVGGTGKPQAKDGKGLHKVNKQPTRTTKTSQKLVVFPEGTTGHVQDTAAFHSGITDLASDDGRGDEGANLVHYSYDVAKEKEAERLRRLVKEELPRVTGYATARSYKMDELTEFLDSMRDMHGTRPKRYDECIYTTFSPLPLLKPSPVKSAAPGRLSNRASPRSTSPVSSVPHQLREDASLNYMTPPTKTLADLESGGSDQTRNDSVPSPTGKDASTKQPKKHVNWEDGTVTDAAGYQPLNPIPGRPRGELFFFDYGVVVTWGLTEIQERRILDLLAPYEEEPIDRDDQETEEFRYQYRAFSQPRIFNDIITLRAPYTNLEPIGEHGDTQTNLSLAPSVQDEMIKLSISHAIAQSVTLALYEERIDVAIESTKHIPVVMARTGKVPLSRANITKKMGQLFVMRIDVNLVSSILDTPEIFWSEPSLEPLYMAVRGYLEISQRVELLNQRCGVLSDLLDMLREHLNSAHGETLEWIVIILIGIEILIGLVEIAFDFVNFYGKPHSAGL